MCWHTPGAGQEQVALPGPAGGIETINGGTSIFNALAVASTISIFKPFSISFRARLSRPLLANASHEASSKPATSAASLLKRWSSPAILQIVLESTRRCPCLPTQASPPCERRNSGSQFHPVLPDPAI